jgi:hypothetical protein
MTDVKKQAKSFCVKDSEGSWHVGKADYFSTGNDGMVTFYLDNSIVAIFRDFKVLRQEDAQ